MATRTTIARRIACVTYGYRTSRSQAALRRIAANGFDAVELVGTRPHFLPEDFPATSSRRPRAPRRARPARRRDRARSAPARTGTTRPPTRARARARSSTSGPASTSPARSTCPVVQSITGAPVIQDVPCRTAWGWARDGLRAVAEHADAERRADRPRGRGQHPRRDAAERHARDDRRRRSVGTRRALRHRARQHAERRRPGRGSAALGPHLVHCHAHDNDGRADSHDAIGSGTLDWPQLARALVRAGYEGAITIEVGAPNPDGVAARRQGPARRSTCWTHPASSSPETVDDRPSAAADRHGDAERVLARSCGRVPATPEDMAAEARRCAEAGAAILHMHADDWPPAIRAVRGARDLIVQCGMSSRTAAERRDVFAEKADMISIITSHHDEAFVGVDVHTLHPREELLEYARLQAESGVRLEYEIWHAGAIWNLNWLIEHASLEPPYFTSIFFGWPGGSWSPPTVEEYAYRRRQLPAGLRRDREHHGRAPDRHRDRRHQRRRPRPRGHGGPSARPRRRARTDAPARRRGRRGRRRARTPGRDARRGARDLRRAHARVDALTRSRGPEPAVTS